MFGASSLTSMLLHWVSLWVISVCGKTLRHRCTGFGAFASKVSTFMQTLVQNGNALCDNQHTHCPGGGDGPGQR